MRDTAHYVDTLKSFSICAECQAIKAFTDEDWKDPQKEKFAQEHMRVVHGIESQAQSDLK